MPVKDTPPVNPKVLSAFRVAPNKRKGDDSETTHDPAPIIDMDAPTHTNPQYMDPSEWKRCTWQNYNTTIVAQGSKPAD